MRNLLKTIIISFLFLAFANSVNAQNIAGISAKLVTPDQNSSESINKLKVRLTIKKVLTRYNSPLIEETDAFVNTCFNYDLDCYLLPSITGLESSFGKFVHSGSFNPFGWGGGYILFEDWSKGIDTVGKGLRQNYVNRGADTIDKIAPIYAESKTWAPRVTYFRNIFAQEEANISSILKGNTVQL